MSDASRSRLLKDARDHKLFAFLINEPQSEAERADFQDAYSPGAIAIRKEIAAKLRAGDLSQNAMNALADLIEAKPEIKPRRKLVWGHSASSVHPDAFLLRDQKIVLTIRKYRADGKTMSRAAELVADAWNIEKKRVEDIWQKRKDFDGLADHFQNKFKQK